MVTDIQRFSVHDGPGIRTTVFLKGCNLRCLWCHNPETLQSHPELQVTAPKCIGCGSCLAICPRGAHIADADGRRVFRREVCSACGRCAAECFSEALVLIGRQITPQEVLAEVRRDRAYYAASGGGVTLSGGEPLCQADFGREVLVLCKGEGFSTAVETNGAWAWERFEPLLPALDLVILDIKAMDADLHRRWTGGPNELILANARRLAGCPQRLIIRTPLVAGANDSAEEVGRIADFIAGFPNLLYYELLPYHPLGTAKYEGLGLAPPPRNLGRPSPAALRAAADAARRRGIPVRIAGRT